MKKLKLNYKKLKNLYIDKKLSAIKISKKMKCSKRTIYLYLKKYNIPIRSLKESWKYRDSITEETKIKMSINKQGDKNPKWNGGRCLYKNYVLIFTPNHIFKQKGNKMFEHRLIMEQYLIKKYPNHSLLIKIENKKYLNPKAVVHHKNGDCSDNRIENLKLFKNQSLHIKYHHIQNSIL